MKKTSCPRFPRNLGHDVFFFFQNFHFSGYFWFLNKGIINRPGVPVRNNAFVPGKPKIDQKVPGKYRLCFFCFVFYTTTNTFITVLQALWLTFTKVKVGPTF